MTGVERPAPAHPYAARDTSAAWFQYTGATGATVTGGATGRRYRFDHPGAIVTVDARDVRSLAAVPVLRQIAPG